MDRTETIRLKNYGGATRPNVYVVVIWEGGKATFGPLSLDSRGGEVANVLPPKFNHPVTAFRVNWEEGQRQHQHEAKAEGGFYFVEINVEWEATGRLRVTSVERQAAGAGLLAAALPVQKLTP